MRNFSFAWVVFGAAVLGGVLLPMQFAHAQLSISPLTFEMTSDPGGSLNSSIRVFNTSESEVTVQMQAQDFAAIGEEGRVVVAEGFNETYSLASWITLDPSLFSLGPKEAQVVNFTVQIPLQGEPGGHYGSILATITGTRSGGAVAISQKIGSLLLLQVSGETKEQLWIKSFEAPQLSEKGPVSLQSRFENIGSVHVKPRGFVTIVDMFGRETANIKLAENNVLPNSLRRIETVWDTGWRFGRFTATLTVIYGSDNEPLSATVTFWIVPVKIVTGVGIGIGILLLVILLMRRRLKVASSILLKGDRR